MTTTLTRPDTQPIRTAELLLAHAHLRLGSLALARTELETLAGMGKLDPLGLVDRAEVRWRTGDLAGAGEAAAVALRGDEEYPVALLIAAEAGCDSSASRRALIGSSAAIAAPGSSMTATSSIPPPYPLTKYFVNKIGA